MMMMENQERNVEHAKEERGPSGGSESRNQMLQRHKQELREVKKVRGKSKTELKKLERELRVRQQAELHALDNQLVAHNASKSLLPKGEGRAGDGDKEEEKEEEEDEDVHHQANENGKGRQGRMPDGLANQQGGRGSKKLSRQQRRKQKREAEDREREKRIQEERKNAGPSAKELETRRLTESLLTKGLGIVQVAPDGDCLYSAVADQIQRCTNFGGAHSTADLRKMAAEYILAHPDDFLPFLSTEEELPQGGLENYCDQVRRAGVWGGQIELRALAQSLQVSIVVHSADAPELCMGEGFEGRNPLRLSFHRHYYTLGEHYNSVVPITIETQQTE